MMCLTCWADCSRAEKAGTLVKRSEPAPFTGYLFNQKTTLDIAQGWRDAEEQNRIINRAYEDLKRESLESVQALQAEIETLDAALKVEAKRQRRERRRKNFWTATTSIIIGGVIGAVIHNNAR